MKGARHVRDNYSDEAMVRRVGAVYEQALRKIAYLGSSSAGSPVD